MKKIAAFLIALIGMGLPLSAENPDPTPEESTIVKVGMNAPRFKVETVGKGTVNLAELRGNVVVVTFWATWCPPCREKLKRVQADLIDRYEGQNFTFLPISRGEDRKTVEKFLNRNGYEFTVGLDPDKAIYSLYATNYIPRDFVIDKNGVVVMANTGYTPEEFAGMLTLIDDLLDMNK